MSPLYSRLQRKKDRELRQHPNYLGLTNYSYSISEAVNDDFGLSFEKVNQRYFCIINLIQGKIVSTAFFSLEEDSFKKRLPLIELLIKKGYRVGWNFMESRTPFKGLSTAEIDRTTHPLTSILEHEGFPPMDRDTVLRLLSTR